MSDFIKLSLKELSQDLNLIQTKKKEMSRKYDIESKTTILDEIKLLKEKAKATVNLLINS